MCHDWFFVGCRHDERVKKPSKKDAKSVALDSNFELQIVETRRSRDTFSRARQEGTK